MWRDALPTLALPVATGIFCGVCLRVYLCLPGQQGRKDKPLGDNGKHVKTMIYFGSGGHTTEMIKMIETLSPERYSPLLFAIGHSDITTKDKVKASVAVSGLQERAKWIRIFRNREVKQSWITTLFTSIWSLLQAFYVIYRSKPQLLICNGPGTCVSLCYSAFFLRVCGITRTKIVFVESFCRTESLSLTGKLLLQIADRFIVHWKGLQAISPNRIEYVGKIF